MFITDYIWIHDFSKSIIHSQSNIIYLEENITELSNDIIHLIPLVKTDTKLTLKPIYVIKNPIYKSQYIILCELYNNELSNNRLNCELTLNKIYKGNYFFNIEQEFIINDPKFKLINTVNIDSLAVGDFFSEHRKFMNEFLNFCVQSDIPISTLYNKKLNKWIYRLNNLMGVHTGDLIWLSRYILLLLTEQYNFKITFGGLVISINDINNNSLSNIDPYLTISVIISTINKVKTEKEIEMIKNNSKKDTLKEQFILKENINKEAELLQQKLMEQYQIESIEIREQHEMEKLNKLKEHQQYIEKLRNDAKRLEEEKILREEKIKIEIMRRKEQEELEQVLLLKEKEKQSIIKEELVINDAELTRLKLLREEIELKKNKNIINSQIIQTISEKERILKEIENNSLELKEEEEKSELRRKEQIEKDELDKLSKMLDEF